MDDPMENTQTRKTLKLNIPTAPVSEKLASAMGDTHTRKTVKLKPVNQSAGNTNSRPVQQVIASPLHSRDTDTGNLSVMSDTQTRKTVKLKPLSPAPHHPVQVPEAAPAAAPQPAAQDADDITRKVSTVKPAMKPGIASLSAATPKPAPMAAPQPAAAPLNVPPPKPAAQDADDITRKVSTVKPAAKPGIELPASSVSPSKQTMVLPEESTEEPAVISAPKLPTVKLDGNDIVPPVSPSKQTMVLPEDDENSATVKIARPPTKIGMIPPKPVAAPAPAPAVSAKPAAPAPAETPAPAEEAKAKPALKKPLTLTKKEEAPAAETPAPAGEAPAEAPKKLSLKKKDDAAAEAATPDFEFDAEPVAADSGSPSLFYTIITAVALILLLASAAISTVNYLNFYEGQNITLPGLSSTK